jgi:hypothetical protein
MGRYAVVWNHICLSVVVNQLDIVRVATHPPEHQPPLVVDSHAMKPLEIPAESLQAVARG